MAAAITNKEVAETVGVLMHGPTFMANPLACSAANASIDLLLESNWKKRVSEIETILRDQLMPLKDHQSIFDVRVLGAIGVIEFNDALDMKKTQEKLIESGVWLRPYGRLLYTMPPFVISDEELLVITQAMSEIVDDSEK
jgi:adenosylmethionine-8-amino-7-oxononanoate aminotransferase